MALRQPRYLKERKAPPGPAASRYPRSLGSLERASCSSWVPGRW